MKRPGLPAPLFRFKMLHRALPRAMNWPTSRQTT
jgi:hypothetical protein